jgi:hypothetical protein
MMKMMMMLIMIFLMILNRDLKKMRRTSHSTKKKPSLHLPLTRGQGLIVESEDVSSSSMSSVEPDIHSKSALEANDEQALGRGMHT